MGDNTNNPTINRLSNQLIKSNKQIMKQNKQICIKQPIIQTNKPACRPLARSFWGRAVTTNSLEFTGLRKTEKLGSTCSELHFAKFDVQFRPSALTETDAPFLRSAFRRCPGSQPDAASSYTKESPHIGPKTAFGGQKAVLEGQSFGAGRESLAGRNTTPSALSAASTIRVPWSVLFAQPCTKRKAYLMEWVQWRTPIS